MRFFLVIFMAAIMSNVPQVVMAETASRTMASTASVVEELSRSEVQSNIESILSTDEIRNKLAQVGLSQDEVSKRLSTLSDSEIRQMATDIDKARYGGDVIGILWVVLLVLLIIYLAKRI